MQHRAVLRDVGSRPKMAFTNMVVDILDICNFFRRGILHICLQYLHFRESRFFADTMQISVIEAQLRLVGDKSGFSNDSETTISGIVSIIKKP